MWWFGAWQHQAITWTNVDLSSMQFCGIQQTLSWQDLNIHVLNKMENLISEITSRLLRGNELKDIVRPSSFDDMQMMTSLFTVFQVGPKKKNLKVKDFDKFEFKPSELVTSICQIYINLGDSDAFCQAVARDGRSYSHSLFVQAENVLQKIMQPPLTIMGFVELGTKVKVSVDYCLLWLLLLSVVIWVIYDSVHGDLLPLGLSGRMGIVIACVSPSVRPSVNFILSAR